MSVFTWIPSYPASVGEQPKVLSASFGDGYEQRAGDGINNVKKIWKLNFKYRSTAEATDIRNFLKTQGGVSAFDWTDPDGDTLRFVCRDWPREFTQGLMVSFSVTFEQVFGV
jgi:phage-related protein